MLRKGVYNIIIDEDFYQSSDEKYDPFLDGKIMEAVLSSFVQYVKCHFENLWLKIRSYQKNELQAVWEIVEDFWSQEGISIRDAVNVRININFDSILECNYIEDYELIKMFVYVIRKEVNNYQFVERSKIVQWKNEILFDDNYLWFISADLKHILCKNGLGKYLSRIFLELNRKHMIRTDNGRLTKKIQVGNYRQTAYQIKKEIFNETGKIDITNLRKG